MSGPLARALTTGGVGGSAKGRVWGHRTPYCPATQPMMPGVTGQGPHRGERSILFRVVVMAHEGLVLAVGALIEGVLQRSGELSEKEWGVDSPATERRAPSDDFSGVRSGGSVCVLVRCVSFGVAAEGTRCAEGDMTKQFLTKGKYGADKNYGKQHLAPFRDRKSVEEGNGSDHDVRERRY